MIPVSRKKPALKCHYPGCDAHFSRQHDRMRCVRLIVPLPSTLLTCAPDTKSTSTATSASSHAMSAGASSQMHLRSSVIAVRECRRLWLLERLPARVLRLFNLIYCTTSGRSPTRLCFTIAICSSSCPYHTTYHIFIGVDGARALYFCRYIGTRIN